MMMEPIIALTEWKSSLEKTTIPQAIHCFEHTMTPYTPIRIVFIVLLATLTVGSRADELKQSSDQLISQAQAFLQAQTVSFPGEKSFHVDPPDSRLQLDACAQPEAFLPTNGRLWGHTTVGIRCSSPKPWTVYLQAYVAIHAPYVVSTMALTQGHVIEANQLTLVNGELSKLPADTLTDPQQAIGKTLGNSLPAGMPLRASWLHAPIVIQAGQSVKLISHGNGFDVSTQAYAISSAAAGQAVQVKVGGGQIITGIAQQNGTVQVNF